MFRTILPYLGIYTLFIAFFSLLNILFCFYFDSLLNINVYVVSLAFSLLLSAIFIYFNKKILSEKITFFKKILLVIIGFFYFPLWSNFRFHINGFFNFWKYKEYWWTFANMEIKLTMARWFILYIFIIFIVRIFQN